MAITPTINPTINPSINIYYSPFYLNVIQVLHIGQHNGVSSFNKIE